MFGFILESKIKYFVAAVVAILVIIVLLTNTFSDEDEVASIEAHMKFVEAQKRKHIEGANGREKPRGLILGGGAVAVMENQQEEPKPPDFDVKFYSGKEMAKVVEGEKVPFQIHEVTIENFATEDIRLECKDSFTKFGEIIAPGGHYKFSVTDIFHKRHYWCIAHDVNFGEVKYVFKAYGEGAPRDNNHISLRKDGAYINGKIVNVIEEKSSIKPVLIVSH